MLFWCCSRRKSAKNLKPDKKIVKLSYRNKWKLHKEKSLYLAEFGLNKGFFMAGAEGLEPRHAVLETALSPAELIPLKNTRTECLFTYRSPPVCSSLSFNKNKRQARAKCFCRTFSVPVHFQPAGAHGRRKTSARHCFSPLLSADTAPAAFFLQKSPEKASQNRHGNVQ